MNTIRDRIGHLLRKVSRGHRYGDPDGEFEQIVRDIAREEIRFADAAERERRQKMLEDIRAGRLNAAFVNYGENPEQEEPTT